MDPDQAHSSEGAFLLGRVEGADLLQAAIARGDQSSSEEGEEDSDEDDRLVDSDSAGEEL